MREPAVQRSPLSEKMVNSAASSARSTSASSNTSTGDLPPSSIEYFDAAGAGQDLLAGDGAAGERDGAHARVTHQRIARIGAIALHHVQHAGRNACLQRQHAELVGGQRRQLDIFSTAVLPSARHGAVFQVAVMKGTFHGETNAHTPTGWYSV